MLGSGDSARRAGRSFARPQDIAGLDCNSLIVEGGAQTASAFLRAGLVDRLMLYRAPILIGGGKPCLGDIGLDRSGRGAWPMALYDARMLGNRPI
jgi:diaminohydroxyphosphoribosylaminopyrimidine deaminase/5-amino-6-(5-phosphoribosylamino)uracil reductase